ncbi:hypothetical protein ABIC02_007451 [Bradyrhizobium sp. RT5a]
MQVLIFWTTVQQIEEDIVVIEAGLARLDGAGTS